VAACTTGAPFERVRRAKRTHVHPREYAGLGAGFRGSVGLCPSKGVSGCVLDVRVDGPLAGAGAR
jgi:hypothetical protein